MKTTITGISGIGPDTAKVLHERGFKTLSAIAGTTIEQLCGVPGFGTTRASRVIRAANELLATSALSSARTACIEARPQRSARQPAGNTTRSGKSKQAAAREITQEDQQKAAKREKEKAKKAKLKEKEKKARLKKEKKKATKLKKEKKKKAGKKKSEHKKNKK
jgi:hypothetical protein